MKSCSHTSILWIISSFRSHCTTVLLAMRMMVVASSRVKSMGFPAAWSSAVEMTPSITGTWRMIVSGRNAGWRC